MILAAKKYCSEVVICNLYCTTWAYRRQPNIRLLLTQPLPGRLYRYLLSANEQSELQSKSRSGSLQ
jgi:hypothetical protein